mmetsp:Transcript_19228/g.58040  ORF Transcript_19228/g.58040 Transcript_19228/m.58040 type:complete len:85 (+) Transcript_19228:138-392(+)
MPTEASPPTEPQQGTKKPQRGKTKEEALDACIEEHRALLSCFKSCSFMGWCCREEHHEFWDCYNTHRGEEVNVFSSFLFGRGWG